MTNYRIAQPRKYYVEGGDLTPTLDKYLSMEYSPEIAAEAFTGCYTRDCKTLVIPDGKSFRNCSDGTFKMSVKRIKNKPPKTMDEFLTTLSPYRVQLAWKPSLVEKFKTEASEI